MILKHCYDIQSKPTSEKQFYIMDNEANSFSYTPPRFPATINTHTNIKQCCCYDIISYITKSQLKMIEIGDVLVVANRHLLIEN